MSLPGTHELSLDQAPPLSIPGSFFVTAPVAIAAGGLLLLTGDHLFATPFHPHTIALTHLGTLGFLAMVMFGALYQMLPVVAGSPVPLPRLAHWVHGALAGGVALLVLGFLTASPYLLVAGGGLLALALTLFTSAISVALIRAPTVDVTVWGMRIAMLSLLALGTMGLAMVAGHSGYAFPGSRPLWMQAHLTLGLLGWVGTLIGAVSLKVVPMFYLTESLPVRRTQVALGAIVLGLSATLVALFAGGGATVLAVAAAPAATAIWVAHPLATLRRKRTDASLQFWQVGLSIGLLCGPAALLALFGPFDFAPLLFGWLAIWGWAGLILHGMLYRIVPFLVWFHRLSKLVGIVPVPPMRRILPDAMAQRSYNAHLVSIAVGALAIGTGVDWVAKLTGVTLLLVAGLLGAALFTVLWVQAPPIPQGSPTIESSEPMNRG